MIEVIKAFYNTYSKDLLYVEEENTGAARDVSKTITDCLVA